MRHAAVNMAESLGGNSMLVVAPRARWMQSRRCSGGICAGRAVRQPRAKAPALRRCRWHLQLVIADGHGQQVVCFVARQISWKGRWCMSGRCGGRDCRVDRWCAQECDQAAAIAPTVADTSAFLLVNRHACAAERSHHMEMRILHEQRLHRQALSSRLVACSIL